MAKRELSSTLKILKFMHRAAQNEDKRKKEEEVKPDGNSVSRDIHRKCIVIIEGSPHPGALKGRMSFQSFNPSMDKLNEEEATSSGNADRENESSRIRSEGLNVSRPGSDSDVDHKKKQPEVDEGAQYPNKIQRNVSDGTVSSGEDSYKQHNHENLDWNVLRPPKTQSKWV